MFVAASTECFPGLPLDESLDRLVDLEYTSVEIGILAGQPGLQPAEVLADLERCIALCRNTQRLTPVAYFVECDPGPDYYKQFAAISKLAKATKVVTITVRSGELGTPFNEEIERLRGKTEQLFNAHAAANPFDKPQEFAADALIRERVRDVQASHFRLRRIGV